MPGLLEILQNPNMTRFAYGLAAAAQGARDPVKGAALAQDAEKRARIEKWRRLVAQSGASPDDPLSWNYDLLAAGLREGVLEPDEVFTIGSMLYQLRQGDRRLSQQDRELTRRLQETEWRWGPGGLAQQQLRETQRWHDEVMRPYYEAMTKRILSAAQPGEARKPMSEKDFLKVVLDAATRGVEAGLKSQNINLNPDMYTRLMNTLQRTVLQKITSKGDVPRTAVGAALLAREAIDDVAREMGLARLAQDPTIGRDVPGKGILVPSSPVLPDVLVTPEELQQAGLLGAAQQKQEQGGGILDKLLPRSGNKGKRIEFDLLF